MDSALVICTEILAEDWITVVDVVYSVIIIII